MRNALSLYSIQGANYILPWFTFPYLTRVLGAEKFGLVAFAQAFVFYFVVITEYGFNFTATREVSIHRDDPEKLSRIFSATMAAKTILMIASFIVMTAVVFAVPRFRQEAPLFYVTFMLVIANVIFPVWLFQGLEKMQYITYREVGTRLIGLAPTFLLVHGPQDYLMAAVVQSGSLLAGAIVAYIGFSRVTAARLHAVSAREIWRTFREGWHVFLSTAAITMYGRSNTFLLGLFAGNAEVGYFSAAVRLIDAAKALVAPLTMAIFPHFSRIAHESPEQGIAFIRRNSIRLTAPFILLFLGVLLGAPVIGPVLFGRKFGPSVPLLQIMSPIPAFVAVSSMYATYYLLGMGHKKQWTTLLISAGVVNFIVLIPLLYLTKPSFAVSVTLSFVEFFVAAAAYGFYRWKTRTV